MGRSLTRTLFVVATAVIVSACAPASTSPPPSEKPVSESRPSQGGAATAGPGVSKGADREQQLIARAQTEREVQWYTVAVQDFTEPLRKAFTAKYPFIDLQIYRANSQDVIQRVLTEYQAGRFVVDMADGTSTVYVLKQAGYCAEIDSPVLDQYPPELKDKERKWVAQYLGASGIAYNTTLLSSAEVPKSYRDLLDPKWKGRMAWSTSDKGGPGFVGNILQTMGEAEGMAYLERLASQEIANVNSSTRAITDQVIAGEYPMNIYASAHHVAASQAKGAPVAWQPLQPVPMEVTASCLLQKAPHPYAAMLFLDFLHGQPGQQVFAEVGYLPANPTVPAKISGYDPRQAGYKSNFMEPEALGANMERWTQIYRRLFLR